MATIGTQRRHDADNWTGYECGWIEGKTWAEPSKRSRGERIESAGHRVLAVTMAPLLVVVLVALWAGVL